MGRRQYLSRLALGRSAFQEPDDDERPPLPTRTVGDGDDAQQYDSKGRPVNPQVEAFNAEMRKAQNEVLALVGVVERKELADQAIELRFTSINKHRQALLFEENERGELLEYLFLPINYFCHLWSDAFRQRIQIGFYHTSRSIAEIFATEWRAIYRGSWKWSLATRFPAVGDMLSHALVRLPLMIAVEQITGRLQEVMIRRRAFGRRTEHVYKIMSMLFEILLLGIDTALLPMEFHALAQRLGLAPVLPLFPPLVTFLPWHPESFHQYGWRPLCAIPLLRRFTSPAAMLLMYKYINPNADDTEILPLRLATSFRYPRACDDPQKVAVPGWKDPVGRVLYNTYRLRRRFMKWAGWTIVEIPDRPKKVDDFEGDTRLDQPLAEEPLPVHRSTAMAHLPAQMLADSIDSWFARLMILPYESLMLRTVALTYLAAPVAKTTAGLKMASHLYSPFGGGPLMRLFENPSRTSASSDAGQYVSRLGLAMALKCTIDAVIFFGVCRSVRQIGVRHFDWGRKGKTRKVIYSEAGVEGFEGVVEEAET